MSPVRIEAVESTLLIYVDLVVAEINSQEVSKCSLSIKTLKNMQDFKLFSFSLQLQIRHYKTQCRISSAFKTKYKEKKNLQRKEKMKKTTSTNVNSREVLKIE